MYTCTYRWADREQPLLRSWPLGQDTASADVPSRSSKSGAIEIDAVVLIDDVQVVDIPERARSCHSIGPLHQLDLWSTFGLTAEVSARCPYSINRYKPPALVRQAL